MYRPCISHTKRIVTLFSMIYCLCFEGVYAAFSNEYGALFTSIYPVSVIIYCPSFEEVYTNEYMLKYILPKYSMSSWLSEENNSVFIDVVDIFVKMRILWSSLYFFEVAHIKLSRLTYTKFSWCRIGLFFLRYIPFFREQLRDIY